MGLDDLMRDPFFVKFIQRTARMLGEWYQSKANTMTNDELYADAEFFPMYSPERDYSEKPEGYVCRGDNGVMMRLSHGATVFGADGVGLLSSSVPASKVVWQNCWSTDPNLAKEFVASNESPYGVNECCSYEGEVYRSLKDQNVQSPADAPSDWEKV